MNRIMPITAAEPGPAPAQLETLRVLLDMIVPPSGDGRMPGAAEVAVLVSRIADAGSVLAGLRELIDTLDRAALDQYGVTFAAADQAKRVSLLEEMRTREPVLLDLLALETVTCYYQQDRVMEGLGLEARPPYPKGYQIEQGDLSLLSPVIARGKLYRDVS